MQKSKTKRQHYVWRYYLAGWENTKKQMYCWQRSENKIFSTSAKNLGVKDYFYQQYNLTRGDIYYLGKITDLATDHKLREINKSWVNYTVSYLEILNKLNSNTEIQNQYSDEILEFSKYSKQFWEGYHTQLETQALPLLKRIKKITNIKISREEKIELINFITNQYFRTKNMKNTIVSIYDSYSGDLPKEISDWNQERTWPIESIIFSQNVASSIINQLDNYKFSIIENCTDVQFITGDQPVINLKSSYDDSIEFYYPLSPNRSLRLAVSEEKDDFKNENISSLEVHYFNQKIINKSEEQVYSNDIDLLSTLKVHDKILT